MRERFVPRVLEAAPDSLVDEAHDNLDPVTISERMMTNEKPGGHGERSVAVGTIDMAVWDAVAKIAGQPLWRLLAERYRDGKADDRVWVYAAGGYYYPGKDIEALKDEMQSYLRSRLSRGQDEDRRRAAGRGSEAHRSGAGSGGRRAASRASTPTAASTSRPRSPTPRPWRPTICAGTRRRAIRSTMRSRRNWRSTIDGAMATGENLFSIAMRAT